MLFENLNFSSIDHVWIEYHVAESIIHNNLQQKNFCGTKDTASGPTQPFPSVREIYLFTFLMDKPCNPI
jgi:hypothetical protein